ncbi:MAG: GNAT family N-acetyltransferase [Anaerolineae bacterium]|jgi:N-acetylglutamate synthase-like GNAT family acetyltransferase|nr:GNAT family N-acetyltransferase [Anaerolineae bacterium]
MIVIRSPQTKEDFKDYYALRYQVLRQPWGQHQGSEKDDYEPISRHFMAVDDGSGELLGVVKLLEKEPGVAWFSHLAVAPRHQRTGIGRLLVEHVEEVARQEGFRTIGAYSRLNSTEYFKRFGYQITGLPSPYFGAVQVVWMEKSLD